MPDTLRATTTVSAAILASRVLGLMREAAFAALFGAGAIADAFQVAFRIPNLLRDLLAEGALSSAFVPTFTAELKQHGPARAYALGNLALSAILVVTGSLTAIGVAFAEPIVSAISAGFAGDTAKVATAAHLTRIMMPILSVVSLGAVWMGMLNAQRRFVTPAIAPAVFNTISLAVAGLVWLRGDGPDAGIVVWSFGTLAAGAVQAAVGLVALWRLGYRPRLPIRGLLTDRGLRRILLLMGPATVGLAAIQINIFVNTRFAGSLGDGAVAQLGYAFRLFFVPLGMFGVALGTVTTTSVSEAAAVGDRQDIARRAADSVRAGWMLVTASAVGMFALAEPLVSVIYERGATSAADAAAIAFVLRAYLLGLVPYSLIKIVAPAFYTVDRPRIPLVASVSGVVANITFNALTYRQLGAPGIALGTAIGATVNLTILRLAFGSAVAPLRDPDRVANLGRLVVANALMGAAVYGGWRGWAELAITGTAATAGALAVAIALGFAVFAGTLKILRYPGGNQLWQLPGRVLARLRR